MIFLMPFTSQLPSVAGKKPTTSYCGLNHDSLEVSFLLRLSSLWYDRGRFIGGPPLAAASTCPLNPMMALWMTLAGIRHRSLRS